MRKYVLVASLDGLGDLIMRLPFYKSIIDSQIYENYIIFVSSKIEKDALAYFFQYNLAKIKIIEFNGKNSSRTILWLKLFFFSVMMRNKISSVFLLNMNDGYLTYLLLKILNPSDSFGRVIHDNNKIKKLLKGIVDDNFKEIKHKTDLAIKFSHLIGLKASIEDIYFPVDTKKIEIDDWLSSLKSNLTIAFGPSSGGQSWKLWPAEYYVDLGKRIIQEYPSANLLLIGSGADHIILEKIHSRLQPENVKIVYNKSLEDVRLVLHCCKLLICGCAGIAHIGSTVKELKIIGIYGPTNPDLTAPRTSNFIRIQSNMRCCPCFDHRIASFLCEEIKCLKEITPNVVWERIKLVLFSK